MGLAICPGDRVTVRAAEAAHHHRTPWFLKGKSGIVRRLHGAFPNPESRAHGGTGMPKRTLCQVEFRQSDIWGREYHGRTDDVLLADIFEQWLERGRRGQGHVGR